MFKSSYRIFSYELKSSFPVSTRRHFWRGYNVVWTSTTLLQRQNNVVRLLGFNLISSRVKTFINRTHQYKSCQFLFLKNNHAWLQLIRYFPVREIYVQTSWIHLHHPQHSSKLSFGSTTLSIYRTDRCFVWCRTV